MFPGLYAILDASIGHESVLALADSLVEGGVRLIQLRSKHYTSRKLFDETALICLRMRDRGVRLLVNDRADIAALAGFALLFLVAARFIHRLTRYKAR